MFQFNDVIGQSQLKAELIKQANSGSLHHAHLFLGKLGYGSFPLALAFIKYIYCSEKSATDSCGLCSNCLKVDKFNHPDIHWAFPTFESKVLSAKLMSEFKDITHQTNGLFDLKDWQDFNNSKNSKIRSDECEAILHNMGLFGYEDGYKTQVIWMMEDLEREANKILKILEEPNPKTIFILIAENSEYILPTIISRCNIVRVAAMKSEEVRTYLAGLEQKIHTDEIERAIIFSEGNLIESKRYIDDSETEFSLEHNLLDFLKGLINFNQRKFSTINRSLVVCDELTGQSKNVQRKFLDYFQYFLRQLVVLKVANSCQLNDNLLKAAHYFAQLLDIDQIEHWSHLIDETYRAIEGNANVKISFVSLTIGSGKIQHRQEFEEFIN